jgi:hypothetical protein
VITFLFVVFLVWCLIVGCDGGFLLTYLASLFLLFFSFPFLSSFSFLTLHHWPIKHVMERAKHTIEFPYQTPFKLVKND